METQIARGRTVAGQIVVGLYDSKGYALDARNRLKTEGVPERDISLVVLREIAPVPRTLEPELAMLEADPLVVGNVREKFARFIRNGETAVLVRAETPADVQFATDIMALFTPLAIELVTSQVTVIPVSAAISSTE
jgi:hypothetical protein